jgi:hypothetical protein
MAPTASARQARNQRRRRATAFARPGSDRHVFINMQAHYDAEITREQLATELATTHRIA